MPPLSRLKNPIMPPKSHISSSKQSGTTIGRIEFIVLMSMMSALDALSIDSMMPALDQISTDLGFLTENHRQLVITSIFAGFALGVLVYGFIADRFGRRGPVILGFLVYGVGTLACIFAASMEVLMAGRVLQGIGAAGPYVLSIAIVRDLYRGRDMAQIMSLIMMVFIGVPMIAPLAGQGVLVLAGWRGIFAMLAVFAAITAVWYWLRQHETLAPENRQALSAANIRQAFIEVLTNGQTLRYLIAMGVLMGAFIAYLSTAPQIFQEMYALGELFPLTFAAMASLFGIGSYVNSRWVHSAGSARLISWALLAIILASLLYMLIKPAYNMLPPLWMHVSYVSTVMFCFAFLFGNITSLALEPMGHIAGAASSIYNSINTLLAIGIAMFIGSHLHSNGLPVVLGFLGAASIAWLLNCQYRAAAAKPA